MQARGAARDLHRFLARVVEETAALLAEGELPLRQRRAHDIVETTGVSHEGTHVFSPSPLCATQGRAHSGYFAPSRPREKELPAGFPHCVEYSGRMLRSAQQGAGMRSYVYVVAAPKGEAWEL